MTRRNDWTRDTSSEYISRFVDTFARGSFCGMRVSDFAVLEPFEVDGVPVFPPVFGVRIPTIVRRQ
ncbi:MAG TPA: hypothetical protein VHV99_21885 [Paraburkholderia sp.]|jgi:hypothetical protein|nr:hypothetical protein [Paraburkholderia sp.]